MTSAAASPMYPIMRIDAATESAFAIRLFRNSFPDDANRSASSSSESESDESPGLSVSEKSDLLPASMGAIDSMETSFIKRVRAFTPMTDMTGYYARLEKTPLPSAEQLGVESLDGAHLVEYFQEVCGSCGFSPAKRAFAFAMRVACRPEGVSSAKAILDECDRLKLKMCCRNLILSPLVGAVVCADIGAKYIAPNVAARVRATSENAPPALSQAGRESFLPPLVIT